MDGKITKVSSADGGLTIEGVKKEKLKGEKYDVFIHTSNIIVTALNTDDKWRINKLEGKNVRAVRPESDKKETQKELEIEKQQNNENMKEIQKSTDKIKKQKKSREVKK